MALITLRQYMKIHQIAEGNLYYLKKQDPDGFPRAKDQRRDALIRKMVEVYDEDELEQYLKPLPCKRGPVGYLSYTGKNLSQNNTETSLRAYAETHRLSLNLLNSHKDNHTDFPVPCRLQTVRRKNGLKRTEAMYLTQELDAFNQTILKRQGFDEAAAQAFIRKPFKHLHDYEIHH